MRPVDFFAAIGDVLVQVCKSPFRDEPMTAEEFDSVSDLILKLCEQGKRGEK